MAGKLWFFSIFMCTVVSCNLSAQNTFIKANKQFELKAFELAIENYKEALAQNPDLEEAKVCLAECYLLLNQPQEAMQWYERVADKEATFSPLNMLNYAHSLKSLGLYERAKIWYWKYSDTNADMANHFAASCDFAMELLDHQASYMVSPYDLNSPESDFGPSFFQDKLVVSSFREDIVSTDSAMLPKDEEGVNGSRLFMEDPQSNEFMIIETLDKAGQSLGPASFSKSGKMVAYTKNNFVNGQRQIADHKSGLSIYYAMTDPEGDFDKVMPFPYNSQEFSNGFPNLSFNGHAIYFASNKPGGQGGFDLYVSYFKNGHWSEPENLGAAINSPGDEISPYFDGTELYFASDYHFGMGSFDLFMTKLEDGEWVEPVNLGTEVNTPADEFYPYLHPENQLLYFTSNRMGGPGKEDIYVALKQLEYTDRGSERKLILNPEETAGESLELEDAGILVAEKTDILFEKAEEDDAAEQESLENEMALAEEAFKWDNDKLSLEGAKKIDLGEIIDTGQKVYFIQLAALSKSEGDFDRFNNLADLGNIYKSMHSNLIKIKLGYYNAKNEADQALTKVRRAGFADAFITFEHMNDGNLQLVTSSMETASAPKRSQATHSFRYSSQSPYKVRLASYSDPLWFDTEMVDDLGRIEQWTKGSWTIFVLSGYPTPEDASKARMIAVQRGFRDAELVVDNGGILERLNK